MFVDTKQYDVIVVGAGHAGCEAALAAARMGVETLVITIAKDKIAHMPCNPAIGGLAKGHLVKEMDALGGEMGKAADATGIQFRVLNRSKGPATRGTRCQSDMHEYSLYMQKVLQQQARLTIIEAMVDSLLFSGSQVVGVVAGKIEYFAKAVVVTTGTFLNGLIHRGEQRIEAGRHGEPASKQLTLSLAGKNLRTGRLKTGTPARLDKHTIDWSQTTAQWGDEPTPTFSFWNIQPQLSQVCCHITYTNANTHQVVQESLHRSAMYSGAIQGIGPRYCPSIEDKIVRFADKDRHQIFLEPTGLDTEEIYPNGLSTSLPAEVQLAFLQTIPGLEQVEMIRAGYAIEYDFVFPNQLYPSLESKDIVGLFLAGQINGTSGYEEAGAQGLMAGINAALLVQNRSAFVLGRNEAYIGVLIDDLITKGTNEPYRMFTSRAEYRLLLREDNADLRLSKKGYEVGLLPKENLNIVEEKIKQIHALTNRLQEIKVTPTKEVNQIFLKQEDAPLKTVVSARSILKRPAWSINDLRKSELISQQLHWNDYWESAQEQVGIVTKYEGYIARQQQELKAFRYLESVKVPSDFQYRGISGLSREVIEKLEEYRPVNLGQASRISGITPAAMSILQIYLKNHDSMQTKAS